MEKNCKYEEEELLEKEFQSQVMNMKQKYGEIPVPAHARDRMLAGIRQAKEEKERSVSRVISLEDRKGRKNMKNHVWMKRTAVAAAAVLVTVGALANISPVTANAMEKLPIIGTLAKVMTFRAALKMSRGILTVRSTFPRSTVKTGPRSRPIRRSRSMQSL